MALGMPCTVWGDGSPVRWSGSQPASRSPRPRAPLTPLVGGLAKAGPPSCPCGLEGEPHRAQEAVPLGPSSGRDRSGSLHAVCCPGPGGHPWGCPLAELCVPGAAVSKTPKDIAARCQAGMAGLLESLVG